MPKGSIQILFKDKAGLQRSVVEAARRRVRAEVLLPSAEAAPGLDRLIRFGERWVAYMWAVRNDGGCFFSSTWTELQSKPGTLRDLVGEDRQGWLVGLTATIEHGVDAGQLTSVASAADEARVLIGLGMALNADLQFSRSANPTSSDQALADTAWVNQVERFR